MSEPVRYFQACADLREALARSNPKDILSKLKEYREAYKEFATWTNRPDVQAEHKRLSKSKQ